MRKKSKGSSCTFPAWRLMLAGFLVGVLLPNILWKMEWQQQTMASMYLLSAFSGREISGLEYLLEVFRMRGTYFLIAFFCGLSVFGVPLAILWIVLTGMKAGALLTMSIRQLGLAGGAAGVGLLFPQYLLYLPVLTYFLREVYAQSMDVWKNKGLFPQKVCRYGGVCAICGIFYFGGILLEVYCNPWIVEMLIKKLKFL